MRNLHCGWILSACLCIGLAAGAQTPAPAEGQTTAPQSAPEGQAAPRARRPAPGPPQNLQVLPKDISRADLIATMQKVAGSLGVRCDFCHVPGNFASDDKDTKQTARRMLRMVNDINKDNFSGRPEVSCYTCHRGSTMPESQLPAKPEPAPGS